jgi:hypothetical protein
MVGPSWRSEESPSPLGKGFPHNFGTSDAAGDSHRHVTRTQVEMYVGAGSVCRRRQWGHHRVGGGITVLVGALPCWWGHPRVGRGVTMSVGASPY